MIGVEGYKYGKCLAQSWLEPIRGVGSCRETDGGRQGPFWLSRAVVREHVLQFPPH